MMGNPESYMLVKDVNGITVSLTVESKNSFNGTFILEISPFGKDGEAIELDRTQLITVRDRINRMLDYTEADPLFANGKTPHLH